MNRKINMFCTIFIWAVIATITACSDKDDPQPEPQKPKTPVLTVAETNIIFERLGSSQTTIITAQNLNETLEITSTSAWCTPELESDSTSLTISCSTNQEPITRTASISLKSGKLSRTIIVKQKGRNDTPSNIASDIKLNIAQATASSFQNKEGIENTYDGKYNTIYHSNWNNRPDNYFPITLEYSFDTADTLNYVIYHPRPAGTGANGRFKQFEIYTINDSGQETKQGDYSLPSTSNPTRIVFDNTILEVKTVKFVINEGYGDGKGFASCAEMEFFKYNSNKFDYTAIFTDPSCSELKTGIGMEQINKINSVFFRELATEIYNNEYDHEFRVQSYRSWQHPDIMARQNKTSTYGQRDNPTGMYANEGDEVVILAGDTHNQSIAIFIQNPDKTVNGTSFPIHTGVNRFSAPHAGLMYVMYYTNTGEEPAVKLNFAKANVNGYFDKTKHTNDDYNRLINKAPFRHFDMIGEYSVLTFETAAFKEYTKTEGMKLISAYDDIVYHEQDFMGLFKYDRAYKNKAYFVITYRQGAYMYSTNHHTAYAQGTQSSILDPEKILKGSIWGPAHELGHTHQTRPGLMWHGMTEVTTNIHSQYLQTLFGNQSRILRENRYQQGLEDIIEGEKPHNQGKDVWVKLVPFWQLKLYCVDALGIADFYKDVYEKVRVNPNPSTPGQCQLQFTKICSEAANLDLTDFFEKWGFFRPIDIEIDDYSKRQFTITQEEIDAIKAEIKALNLPAPKHDNIHLITDDNVSDYK